MSGSGAPEGTVMGGSGAPEGPEMGGSGAFDGPEMGGSGAPASPDSDRGVVDSVAPAGIAPAQSASWVLYPDLDNEGYSFCWAAKPEEAARSSMNADADRVQIQESSDTAAEDDSDDIFPNVSSMRDPSPLGRKRYIREHSELSGWAEKRESN